MRITSVRIENFRAIRLERISFLDALGNPRPVTVIAGPNGSGKTSILFAITNALRGVLGYRTLDVPDPSSDDIRIPPSSSAAWREEPPEIRVEVELELHEVERIAIPQLMDVIGREPPPLLDDDRLRVVWSFPPGFDLDGERRRWWQADVEPHLPGIRSWLAARAWAIRAWSQRIPGMHFDLLQQIGGMCFFPQDRNLRERVLEDLSDRDTMAGTTYTVQEDSEGYGQRAARQERTVSEILHYFADYVRNRETPPPDDQNYEARIKRTFNKVCAPKEYVGYFYRADTPLGAPILKEGNLAYPLSHAASGEQIILEYIVRLTHPSPLSRSIVLIDEPEIHLHPAWVRQLYLALPEIGDDNQYILTTHSAELRQRAAADNALIDLGSLDREK